MGSEGSRYPNQEEGAGGGGSNPPSGLKPWRTGHPLSQGRGYLGGSQRGAGCS